MNAAESGDLEASQAKGSLMASSQRGIDQPSSVLEMPGVPSSGDARYRSVNCFPTGNKGGSLHVHNRV
jgi:hypothetical protein